MQVPEGTFWHFGKQTADSSSEFAGQYLRVME